MAGDVKLRLQYVLAEPELFPMGEKEKENSVFIFSCG